jgi:hypothetical protein
MSSADEVRLRIAQPSTSDIATISAGTAVEGGQRLIIAHHSSPECNLPRENHRTSIYRARECQGRVGNSGGGPYACESENDSARLHRQTTEQAHWYCVLALQPGKVGRPEIRSGQRLPISMVSVDCENPWNPRERPVSCKAQPKLPVHPVAVPLVNESVSKRSASHEDRWLNDVVVDAQQAVAVRRYPNRMQNTTFAICQDRMAVHDIRSRMRIKEAYDIGNYGAVEVRVVCIDPADDLAPAQGKSFGQRV